MPVCGDNGCVIVDKFRHFEMGKDLKGWDKRIANSILDNRIHQNLETAADYRIHAVMDHLQNIQKGHPYYGAMVSYGKNYSPYGALSYTNTGKTTLHMTDLGSNKRGVGSFLFDQLVKYGKSAGYKKLTWDSLNDPNTLKFYNSRGTMKSIRSLSYERMLANGGRLPGYNVGGKGNIRDIQLPRLYHLDKVGMMGRMGVSPDTFNKFLQKFAGATQDTSKMMSTRYGYTSSQPVITNKEDIKKIREAFLKHHTTEALDEVWRLRQYNQKDIKDVGYYSRFIQAIKNPRIVEEMFQRHGGFRGRDTSDPVFGRFSNRVGVVHSAGASALRFIDEQRIVERAMADYQKQIQSSRIHGGSSWGNIGPMMGRIGNIDKSMGNKSAWSKIAPMLGRFGGLGRSSSGKNAWSSMAPMMGRFGALGKGPSGGLLLQNISGMLPKSRPSSKGGVDPSVLSSMGSSRSSRPYNVFDKIKSYIPREIAQYLTKDNLINAGLGAAGLGGLGYIGNIISQVPMVFPFAKGGEMPGYASGGDFKRIAADSIIFRKRLQESGAQSLKIYRGGTGSGKGQFFADNPELASLYAQGRGRGLYEAELPLEMLDQLDKWRVATTIPGHSGVLKVPENIASMIKPASLPENALQYVSRKQPRSIKLAGGGKILGRGTSISDSIPARLSRGSYVLDKDTVQALGENFLTGITGSGSYKGLASGGMGANALISNGEWLLSPEQTSAMGGPDKLDKLRSMSNDRVLSPRERSKLANGGRLPGFYEGGNFSIDDLKRRVTTEQGLIEALIRQDIKGVTQEIDPGTTRMSYNQMFGRGMLTAGTSGLPQRGSSRISYAETINQPMAKSDLTRFLLNTFSGAKLGAIEPGKTPYEIATTLSDAISKQFKKGITIEKIADMRVGSQLTERLRGREEGYLQDPHNYIRFIEESLKPMAIGEISAGKIPDVRSISNFEQQVAQTTNALSGIRPDLVDFGTRLNISSKEVTGLYRSLQDATKYNALPNLNQMERQIPRQVYPSLGFIPQRETEPTGKYLGNVLPTDRPSYPYPEEALRSIRPDILGGMGGAGDWDKYIKEAQQYLNLPVDITAPYNLIDPTKSSVNYQASIANVSKMLFPRGGGRQYTSEALYAGIAGKDNLAGIKDILKHSGKSGDDLLNLMQDPVRFISADLKRYVTAGLGQLHGRELLDFKKVANVDETGALTGVLPEMQSSLREYVSILNAGSKATDEQRAALTNLTKAFDLATQNIIEGASKSETFVRNFNDQINTEKAIAKYPDVVRSPGVTEGISRDVARAMPYDKYTGIGGPTGLGNRITAFRNRVGSRFGEIYDASRGIGVERTLDFGGTSVGTYPDVTRVLSPEEVADPQAIDRIRGEVKQRFAKVTGGVEDELKTFTERAFGKFIGRGTAREMVSVTPEAVFNPQTNEILAKYSVNLKLLEERLKGAGIKTEELNSFMGEFAKRAGKVTGTQMMFTQTPGTIAKQPERFGVMANMSKFGKDLSWRAASLSMSSMGVYFSLMGIFMALTGAITSLTTSLSDLNNIFKNVGYVNAFAKGARNAADILGDFGLTQKDLVKGWENVTYAQSAFSLSMTSLAASIFKDKQFTDGLVGSISELFNRLGEKSVMDSFVNFLTSGAKVLPEVVDALQMVTYFLNIAAENPWLIRIATQMYGITLLLQPLTSGISLVTSGLGQMAGMAGKIKELNLAINALNLGMTGVAIKAGLLLVTWEAMGQAYQLISGQEAPWWAKPITSTVQFATGTNPITGEAMFAEGGLITGAATSAIDDKTIRVDEGEYVINKKSANKIGLKTLNQLNKFANGGPTGGISSGDNIVIGKTIAKSNTDYFNNKFLVKQDDTYNETRISAKVLGDAKESDGIGVYIRNWKDAGWDKADTQGGLPFDIAADFNPIDWINVPRQFNFGPDTNLNPNVNPNANTNQNIVDNLNKNLNNNLNNINQNLNQNINENINQNTNINTNLFTKLQDKLNIFTNFVNNMRKGGIATISNANDPRGTNVVFNLEKILENIKSVSNAIITGKQFSGLSEEFNKLGGFAQLKGDTTLTGIDRLKNYFTTKATEPNLEKTSNIYRILTGERYKTDYTYDFREQIVPDIAPGKYGTGAGIDVRNVVAEAMRSNNSLDAIFAELLNTVIGNYVTGRGITEASNVALKYQSTVGGKLVGAGTTGVIGGMRAVAEISDFLMPLEAALADLDYQKGMSTQDIMNKRYITNIGTGDIASTSYAKGTEFIKYQMGLAEFNRALAEEARLRKEAASGKNVEITNLSGLSFKDQQKAIMEVGEQRYKEVYDRLSEQTLPYKTTGIGLSGVGLPQTQLAGTGLQYGKNLLYGTGMALPGGGEYIVKTLTQISDAIVNLGKVAITNPAKAIHDVNEALWNLGNPAKLASPIFGATDLLSGNGIIPSASASKTENSFDALNKNVDTSSWQFVEVSKKLQETSNNIDTANMKFIGMSSNLGLDKDVMPNVLNLNDTGIDIVDDYIQQRELQQSIYNQPTLLKNGMPNMEGDWWTQGQTGNIKYYEDPNGNKYAFGANDAASDNIPAVTTNETLKQQLQQAQPQSMNINVIVDVRGDDSNTIVSRVKSEIENTIDSVVRSAMKSSQPSINKM